MTSIYDPIFVEVKFEDGFILLSGFKGFQPNKETVAKNFMRRFKFCKEVATHLEVFYDEYGNYSIKIGVMFPHIIFYIQNSAEAIDMKFRLNELDPFVFMFSPACA